MKATPGIIAVSVIVLLAIVYGVYKISFAPHSPPPSADNAPAYARDRGMLPGQGAGTAGGGSAAHGAMPSYGQGAGRMAGHTTPGQ